MALEGSTDSSSSVQEGEDPRLVDSLDPRLTSIAEKLLQPILNNEEEKAKVLEDMENEEEIQPCRFEKVENEEMTVQQAKRILKKKLMKKSNQGEGTSSNQYEYVEDSAQRDAQRDAQKQTIPDFDIDNFSMFD